MASKIVKLQFHHAELSLRNNRQSPRIQALLHCTAGGTGKSMHYTVQEYWRESRVDWIGWSLGGQGRGTEDRLHELFAEREGNLRELRVVGQPDEH